MRLRRYSPDHLLGDEIQSLQVEFKGAKKKPRSFLLWLDVVTADFGMTNLSFHLKFDVNL